MVRYRSMGLGRAPCLCAFCIASEQAGDMGSALQADTQSAVDLRPEAWPEPGQEDDTEGGAVLDSGNPDDLPVEPDKPITSQQVATAILEIRTSVVFFVFGVIPLLSAVVFLYLFFRWDLPPDHLGDLGENQI